MASFFNLILDTTAPTGCSISLASLVNSRSVTLMLAATGASQVKIYGDVGSGSTATTEANATWETYVPSKSITLTSGDGAKTVKAKFRDEVGNESAEITASTVLDMTAPTVTITDPDVTTISEVTGFNVCAFSFSADTAFVQWEVRVVPSNSSAHTAGTLIGMTNGSTNMSGSESKAASTAVNCTINGSDLKAANSGDGTKIIKVFVKDAAGNWSV